VSLRVPLGHLTAVRPRRRAAVPSEDAEKIVALVSDQHRLAEVRKAYEMLRRVLEKA